MASPSEPLSPLRIQKGPPSLSPLGMQSGSLPRALSEVAPSSQKRNSPSTTQNMKKMALNPDSSPFQSSPFNTSDRNSSPRIFWQGRDPAMQSQLNSENIFAGRGASSSPTRRSSIEKLQKASRVKNSNMFAREQKQEYDPTSVPIVERPLAKSLQGNAYGGSGLDGLRATERGRTFSPFRANNTTILSTPDLSPAKIPQKILGNSLRSQSKDQMSPTKSSLSASRFKSSSDSEQGVWSEDQSGDEKELPPGRVLHRHAKSVTFDEAPPQVNEYEMATPDISSIGTGSRENSYDSGEDDEDDSYTGGDSVEQDDSFDASLEDTDKTPVVGPDDWRHASPEDHSTEYLSVELDDAFHGPEGSPMPDVQPLVTHPRPNGVRTDSLNSNGEHRPLPPIPGAIPIKRALSTSSMGLSAAAERAKNSGQNVLSPPQPPTVSKEDIQGITENKMPLEERLRLMMVQDEDKPKKNAEKQRERRMRRAGARERSSQTPEQEQSISIYEDRSAADEIDELGNYEIPHRISRESILRQVKRQDSFSRDSDYNFSSSELSLSPERLTLPDPDVPLPSTEDGSILENDDSVIIKREPEDEGREVDIYDIPEMYQDSSQTSQDAENFAAVEDVESQYSDHTPVNQSPGLQTLSLQDEEPRIPGPLTSGQHDTDPVTKNKSDSMLDFAGFTLDTKDFGLSLQSYLSRNDAPEETEMEAKKLSMSVARDYSQRPETPLVRPKSYAMPEYDGTGWGPEEDEEEDEVEVGTPDSVIHHPLSESPPRESPSIPEQVATIKSASGSSKLKTRPSATPADLETMRDLRRHVSGEKPVVPPIPDRHRNRPMSVDVGTLMSLEGGIQRHPSFRNKSLTLDIGNDLASSLQSDLDRVIEVQKRGYLMRQNTKLVVATSEAGPEDSFHSTRSAGNSPVKPNRPQSWTVEPWNGQTRKSSSHNRVNSRKKPVMGLAPAMPGQSRSVTASSVSPEDNISGHVSEDGERGRLFVKVLGVKDLNLPLPKNEQTWFSLTLDNGVHCVTTAWLELGRNAPIGQEFELVVPNELEFQLTLNAKLSNPTPKRVAESPSKGFKAHKPSTFSRVFASPKKRREIEARMREEEERYAQQKEMEAQAKRAILQPTAWDLISPLAAEDGSFGRSYVCLKDHEPRCYGRPYVVEVACFNEWATEKVSHSSSVISKRATTVQRRAPYKVANLELQLLFVPKPKGATDDDMPKSMNSCIREMKEAEVALTRTWEGHLSQQGGDCPYWRRRYFKLTGSKLTAYHESTRQPRATINLANARKLIDDRTALTQKETTGKGGKRRKSGFAEEEEGYMFVEEGFRIRFNNGEVIDFYADTSAEKENWMNVLEGCIGKEGENIKRGWCDMVLKREESVKRRAEHATGARKISRHHQRNKSSMV